MTGKGKRSLGGGGGGLQTLQSRREHSGNLAVPLQAADDDSPTGGRSNVGFSTCCFCGRDCQRQVDSLAAGSRLSSSEHQCTAAVAHHRTRWSSPSSAS